MDDKETIMRRLAIDESLKKTRNSAHLPFVRDVGNNADSDRPFRKTYLPQGWGTIKKEAPIVR